MSLQVYIAVMMGGAIGSAVRLWLATTITDRLSGPFPWGILCVNISGCFLIGLFIGWSVPESSWLGSPTVRLAVTYGLLGGFTTFSTFSMQTVHLLGSGAVMTAMSYAAASLSCCLLATWLGLRLTMGS